MIPDDVARTEYTPPSGLVRDLVDFAYRQTDAPCIYALGASIGMLSALIPSSARLWGPGGSKQRLNIYALVIGESGADRKSTSANIFADLLKEAVPERCGHAPGSPQGLLEALEKAPHQWIVESEFSSFLSQAKKQGGHKNPIKQLYTDLYDCVSTFESLANKDRDGTGAYTRGVAAPRLSLFGCIATPYLEIGLEREDLTGGFWSRFILFIGRRKRFYPPSQIQSNIKSESAFRENMLRRLRRFYAICPGGLGTFSPEACVALDKWAYYLEDETNNLPRGHKYEPLRGHYARGLISAEKIAALFALDDAVDKIPDDGTDFSGNLDPFIMDEVAKSRPDNFTIEARHIEQAVLVTKGHLKCAREIVEMLQTSVEMRFRRRVIEILAAGRMRNLRYLVPNAELAKKSLMPVLESLKAEKRIDSAIGDDGDTWYWSKEEELDDYQEEGCQSLLRGLKPNAPGVALASDSLDPWDNIPACTTIQ